MSEQVVAQCKEAHREHHRLLGEEKPPALPTKGGKAGLPALGAPSKDKDAVFAAALMAVRKGHHATAAG